MIHVYGIGKSTFAIDSDGKYFVVYRLYRGKWLLEGNAPTEQEAKVLLLSAATHELYLISDLSSWPK